MYLKISDSRGRSDSARERRCPSRRSMRAAVTCPRSSRRPA